MEEMKILLKSTSSLLQNKLTPITSSVFKLQINTSLTNQVDGSLTLKEKERMAITSFPLDSAAS